MTIIEDVGKHILTGLVAFFASSLYTSYQLGPKHNVNLIPLAIKVAKSDLACTVDKEKLSKSIKDIGVSETMPSRDQSDTYGNYLRILSSYELVLEEIVPSEHLGQLKKDQILNCNKNVNTFSLETAILFDQPVHYLLRRSCSMMYENMEIPILASNDTSKIDDEILRIRETNNLFFIHDESRMDKSTKEKFSELVKKSIHKYIDLGVKCNVISIDKDTEIGGHAYKTPVRETRK